MKAKEELLKQEKGNRPVNTEKVLKEENEKEDVIKGEKDEEIKQCKVRSFLK